MEHHFVPQFYLKAFRDPSVPEGQEPWLWVADLHEQVVERRAPKNVGRAANYYAFPEWEATGEEPPEQLLAKVESAAAPVVRKLLSGEFELTGQERADLLFFTAVFVTRVPFFRKLIEEFAANLVTVDAQESAEHPEHFARTLREALQGRELTLEEIEATRKIILKGKKYKIRAKPSLSLVLGFEEALDTIYPVLDRMRWAIVRSTGGEHFITSDCPVSWTHPTPRSRFYAGHGLAMKKVEVTFPVGPQLCLLGTWEGPTGVVDATKKMAGEYNSRRVASAERYVFADSEEKARLALAIRQQLGA